MQTLLRSCFRPAPEEVTSEALAANLAALQSAVESGTIDFGGNLHQQAVYRAICERSSDGPPDRELLAAVLESDIGAAEQLKDIVAVSRVWTRTNFHYALKEEAAYCRLIRYHALLKQAATLKPDEGLALIESRKDELRPVVASVKPTADDPLAGLTTLGPIAVRGRDRILELASKPVEYIWNHIAERGSTIVLGASPGGGKTSLLFWLIVARANLGEPTSVLGQLVTPAPQGQNVIVIEEEHQEESTSRLLVKACQRAGIDNHALDRVIFISRKGCTIGSLIWNDIVTMIGAGLVSDIVIDTLARVGPGDSNDEQAQVQVFNAINAAIESAPSSRTRPTFWVAAHVRKSGDGMPTIQDISGSTQRAGAVDVVITLAAKRIDGGSVDSVRVGFPKVREQDAEDSLPLVEFRQTRTAYAMVGVPAQPATSLLDQVVALLAGGPMTKNEMRTRTGRNSDDVEKVITELFAAKRIKPGTKEIRGQEYKSFELRPELPEGAANDHGDQTTLMEDAGL